MRRAGLDASIDSTTVMLIKLAQAMRLSDALPDDTGRRLERMAKSVRLFAEARETKAAVDVADDMLVLVPADGYAEAHDALERAVKRVHAAIGFVGIQDAKARRMGKVA